MHLIPSTGLLYYEILGYYGLNTYWPWSPLILKGCDNFLHSAEGVIQGDPLSMFAYTIAMLPLIRTLDDCSNCIQLWYADNSSALGNITSLMSWFERLSIVGPQFGYFPEPTKSYLVSESPISRASDMFHNTGINVVTSCRFLGGCIGDEDGVNSFVTSKVNCWSHHVELLSSIAKNQPQVGYITLTKSLQQEFIFLQKVTVNCAHLF